MKKLLIVFALTNALFSCKKETTNTNSTTKTSNGVTCLDNPNINFTAIGTPVGKFSDCIKDIDGNVYKTVTIGTQTWMAENLKTSKYNDGTPIPNVKDSLEWSNFTTGAWCYYDNDENYNAKYGKLYNWYAVSQINNGNKNVCPTGWHVPTYAEWTILTSFLGGDSVAGSKLKEVGTTSWIHWNKDATNTTFFSALPGGSRVSEVGMPSFCEHIGVFGLFWSATTWEYDNYYSYCLLLYRHGSSSEIQGKDTYGVNKTCGVSVRCLKN